MKNEHTNTSFYYTTGANVKTPGGKIVGTVVEITYADNQEVEYLIMESNVFFGKGNRYFAIPASAQFINMADQNNVILHLHRDEIPFARGVLADKCPKPNLKFGSSLFELYDYRVPRRTTMKKAAS